MRELSRIANRNPSPNETVDHRSTQITVLFHQPVTLVDDSISVKKVVRVGKSQKIEGKTAKRDNDRKTLIFRLDNKRGKIRA